jgi:hypothetical protein
VDEQEAVYLQVCDGFLRNPGAPRARTASAWKNGKHSVNPLSAGYAQSTLAGRLGQYF